MHLRRLLAALLVAAVGAARALPAAEPWIRVRSPHLEVLSDAGEEKAREAARRLERLHRVLQRLLPPTREGEEEPVCALVFRDRLAFAPIVPLHQGRVRKAEGFFQGGTDCDYMVLHLPSTSSERPRSWETLDHEYAHLHLNRSLPAQPVWVAEGLAEALSDADLEGPEARLGQARSDYLALVQREPRIPLADLLAVGYDSPLYHDDSRNDILYAESWALVRWVVARQGLDGLRSFLAAVAQGVEPVGAFSQHFGDLAAVEATLRETPAGPLFRVTLESDSDPSLVVDVPSEAEVEYRLGDLLLHGGRVADAQRHLERALRTDPSHASARAGLAQVLLHRGRWMEARRELRLALAAHPDDPGVLFRHAQLILDEALDRGEALAPEAEAEAVAALQKAVARAPYLAEAAEILARLKPEPLADRIALLERAFLRDPGRPQLALVLASLHAKRHDIGAARATLFRGREAARDPAYRFLCNHLLSQVEGYAAATAEARGRLVHLECRPDGSLRFTLAVGAETLELEAPSPRSIFVRGLDGDRERELTCGPQDLPLRVRYLPGQEPGRGGTLLTLDVLEEGPSAPEHPQALPPAAHGRLMRPGHHARAEAWVLIDGL
jgi:Tfp pilus assembly protein PilF